jgi:hypothetical protein
MITARSRAAAASASLTGDVAQHRRIHEWLDGVFGNEAAHALLKLAVVVGEDIDGLLRDTGRGHLVLG